MPHATSALKCERSRDNDGQRIRMVRADDGGALRTFNGGLAHENGWLASRKARRLIHWQGTAQYDFLTCAEVEFNVVRLNLFTKARRNSTPSMLN